MIRIDDDVVWRAAPWITERVLHEVSEAMDQGEQSYPGPTLRPFDLDLQGLDASAFRDVARACTEALDFLLLAGPARSLRTEDFIDLVCELSRLRLLLSLDARTANVNDPESAATEFVLANAAAAFRHDRPSVAVLVLEAMPSKRGLATLDRLRPDELTELVRVLESLRHTRLIAAAQEDEALRRLIAAATDEAIRCARSIR